MRTIKQSWEFEGPAPDGSEILRRIERAGRTCYKTEDRGGSIKDTMDFCKKLITSGHHSVLEHCNVSVRIVTDRGVTHEIVRHRLASYSQESTRYCNYSQDKFGNEITVILPVWLDWDKIPISFLPNHDVGHKLKFYKWQGAMEYAERYYFDLIQNGWSAQEARSVLPNSLKTEIVMTANIREWRHFFTLRCSPKAHPQMRELARSMCLGFQDVIPVLFDDIQDIVKNSI